VRIIITVLTLLTVAAPAYAQTHRSYWGLSGTFTPKWEVPSQAGPAFEVEPVDMTGSEFRVGIVRGRDLSGEWGISFVRKTIKNGSRLGERQEFCDNTSCVELGEIYTYNDVTLDGVILHKFVPFGTISRRLQIGLTFGLGAGRFEGDADGEIYETEFSGSNQVNVTVRRETVPAEELFVLPVVPLADLQLSAALILAPGLKVRASGGVSVPGYHVFSASASYLFGAR
jgi:hypothetical protein